MAFRVPDTIQTIFLDMNGTFVFGHDQFGPGTDFFPAYRAAGGARLDRAALNVEVRRVVDRLDALYQGNEFDLDFPSVSTIVDEVAGDLDADEKRFVEDVIARHEMGHIADDVAATLLRLSQRYALVIVSNLWSESRPWRGFLDDVLGEIFTARVFSSDLRINKPAPEIFRHALELARVEAVETVLMVGDDWHRDVEPALELGMQAAWLSAQPRRSESVLQIRSVTELA